MLTLRKISILIAGLDCFIGDSSRGILNPVIWPLTQKCGGSLTELGLLVATYNAGRVVVSAEIGRYADESIYRHRGALLISSFILLVGLLLWSNVLLAGGMAMLFIAQFLMGLGTGNLGVLRSYVAEQAIPQERTWQLARLSALQYAGFAATPIIGSALYVAGYSLDGNFKYSFPSYVVAGIVLVILGLLYYPFKNLEDTEVKRPTSLRMTALKGKENAEMGKKEESPAGKSWRESITARFDFTSNTKNQHPDEDEENDPNRNDSMASIDDDPGIDFKELRKARRAGNTMSLMMNEIVVDDFETDGDETTTSGSLVEDLNKRLKRISGRREKMKPMNSAIQPSKDENGPSATADIPTNPMFASSRENNFSVDNFDDDDPTLGMTCFQRLQYWINETFFYTSTEETDLNSVYLLFICLNFTTRGVVSIYETIGTELLLDKYGLSQIQTGAIISITGAVGTLNLVLFKEFWTAYCTDMALMMGGLTVVLAAQLFLINYGKDQPHPLWEYALSLSMVYAFGYPIANSAVLGIFSKLIKKGRQGKAQGHFAFMGGLARIIMPIAAGYTNEYGDASSSFAIACILMSGSLCGVCYLYHRIIYFKDTKPKVTTTKSLHTSEAGKLIAGTIAQNNSMLKRYEEDPGYFVRNQKLSIFQIVVIFLSGSIGFIAFLSIFDFFHPGW